MFFRTKISLAIYFNFKDDRIIDVISGSTKNYLVPVATIFIILYEILHEIKSRALVHTMIVQSRVASEALR